MVIVRPCSVVHKLYKPPTHFLPRSCKLQLCLPLRHPMFQTIVSQNLIPPLKWCSSLSSHRPYPWLSFLRMMRGWLAPHPLPRPYFDLHIAHIIHPQSLGSDFVLIYRLTLLWLYFRLPFVEYEGRQLATDYISSHTTFFIFFS